jgi:hypothetical protein
VEVLVAVGGRGHVLQRITRPAGPAGTRLG